MKDTQIAALLERERRQIISSEDCRRCSRPYSEGEATPTTDRKTTNDPETVSSRSIAAEVRNRG